MGWKGVDRIHLAQKEMADFVNTVLNLRVAQNMANSLPS
jgi:hypothetical protein